MSGGRRLLLVGGQRLAGADGRAAHRQLAARRQAALAGVGAAAALLAAHGEVGERQRNAAALALAPPVAAGQHVRVFGVDAAGRQRQQERRAGGAARHTQVALHVVGGVAVEAALVGAAAGVPPGFAVVKLEAAEVVRELQGGQALQEEGEREREGSEVRGAS